MDCKSLDEVRENIDRIDDEIIKLMAQRGQYVLAASAFKKDRKAVGAPERVAAVILKVRKKAEAYGADPDMVENLYRMMIESFIKMEMEAFNKEKQAK